MDDRTADYLDVFYRRYIYIYTYLYALGIYCALLQEVCGSSFLVWQYRGRPQLDLTGTIPDTLPIIPSWSTLIVLCAMRTTMAPHVMICAGPGMMFLVTCTAVIMVPKCVYMVGRENIAPKV